MKATQFVQSTVPIPLVEVIDFVNTKVKGEKIPHGSIISATVDCSSDDGVFLVLKFTHELGSK